MYVRWRASLGIICLLSAVLSATPAAAAEWFVAPGGTGTGTAAAPFGRIQDGLNAAQPGDVVSVRPGTYAERLSSVRSGTPSAPIRIRATERGAVLITAPGRVASIAHEHLVLEDLVLDGQYGADDTVRITSNAHRLVLRRLEVRRSSRDLIDMGAPHDVLIEGCLIHRALNAANGRTDAHGIVAGAVRNLTIRDTEIHTFSGDGVQVDPGRSAPGWDNVTLESVRIWLAPLAAAENGFPAGTVAGENAVDTKASPSLPRARLTIRDVTASGFRGGLLANMAAFNLKEHITATVDRVTVSGSEIAFRLRGGGGTTTPGAWVTVMNAVVYDTDTAFRYEDHIENLRVWNSTIGGSVGRPFRAASSTSTGVEVRNVLVLGPRPPEASHASNISAGPDAFMHAAAHDYRLAPTSVAIDAGVPLAGVDTDRNNTPRPQGAGYDAGAFEHGAGAVPQAPQNLHISP